MVAKRYEEGRKSWADKSLSREGIKELTKDNR